jgi:hypothetical protein
MSGETSRQRKAREKLDRRLDRELEDTFPASDPLEITSPRGRNAGTSDRVDNRIAGAGEK